MNVLRKISEILKCYGDDTPRRAHEKAARRDRSFQLGVLPLAVAVCVLNACGGGGGDDAGSGTGGSGPAVSDPSAGGLSSDGVRVTIDAQGRVTVELTMSHASLRVDRTGEYSLRLTGSGNQIFVGAQNVVTRLELAGSDNKVNLESHVLYRAVVNSGQRNCLLDFNFENWDAAFCPGLLQ